MAVAVSALTIAGCGSSHGSSSSSGSASIDGAAISRAADVSGAEKGEKVAYTMTEQLPSLGTLTMTGTGSFDTSPQQGQMTMKISVPNASSLGSQAAQLLTNLQLQLVIDQGSIYIKLPSSLATMASSYTDGKQWLSVDLDALASDSKIPGLSSLLNGQTTPTNPASELKELEEASSNGITKVGTATVNGVPTTEYKATLDLSKLSSTLPAAERKVLAPQFSKIAKQAGLSQIPFHVYIDSANLVRRLTMNFDLHKGGSHLPLTLNMDFLAYGAQPAPTVPPAAETENLDSLITTASANMGSGTSTAGSGSSISG